MRTIPKTNWEFFIIARFFCYTTVMSVRKIFYNTILQSAGKIISVVIGLFTIALMTRHLRDIGFGEYTTIISYMGFVGILADLGLYLVTTKEISRPGADESMIVGNVFALRMTTVTVLLAAGALLALALPYSPEVHQGIIVGIVAFAAVSGTQVLIGVFQKHLVYYELVVSEIFGRVVMLAGTLLAVRQNWGVLAFVWVLACANTAHFLLTTLLARRLVSFRPRFDLVFWGQILSKSWPLGASVVLNLIYFKADTLILSIYRPAADVGIYGLPYKILEVLLAFPAMFAGLIMPFLSRFAGNDWPAYRRYLQSAFDAILLAIIPMVVTAQFFAESIVGLVGGDGFGEAGKILQILILATAIIYLGNLLGYTVVALDRQRQMLWGYLIGSLVGLLMYFTLIPRYGYFGAAWSTVAVELVVFIYAYALTSRAARFTPSFGIGLKALVAAVPMALIYSLLPGFWMFLIVTGLAAYAGALYLLRAVPKEFLTAITRRGERAVPPVSAD